MDIQDIDITQVHEWLTSFQSRTTAFEKAAGELAATLMREIKAEEKEWKKTNKELEKAIKAGVHSLKLAVSKL
jgi:hypothetical protein